MIYVHFIHCEHAFGPGWVVGCFDRFLQCESGVNVRYLYTMNTLSVRTCGSVPVQSATEWTASVHTLHMSKPVITFVFKVLRNGLLRYMLYTCPNL